MPAKLNTKSRKREQHAYYYYLLILLLLLLMATTTMTMMMITNNYNNNYSSIVSVVAVAVNLSRFITCYSYSNHVIVIKFLCWCMFRLDRHVLQNVQTAVQTKDNAVTQAITGEVVRALYFSSCCSNNNLSV